MFSKIRNRIEKNTFLLSVFKVGSGQLLAQFIAVITVPIMSRIYDEVAYGDYAVLLSTANLICNFSLLGLSSAIMKPKDDNDAKDIFTVAFAINIILTSLIILTSIVFSHYYLLYVISKDYIASLILMWLYVISFNTSQLLTIYINRRGKYNKLFFNPIIGSIVNLIVAIPLGLLGYGLFGFLIASIINYTAICIHLSINDIPFKRIKFNNLIKICIDNQEYVIFQYPANFIGNIAIEYPTQYLGRVFLSSVIGPYSMCLKILKVPIRLIASPISTVYFRTASELSGNNAKLADFTFRFIHKVLVFSLLPIVVCDFFAEYIFSFILGTNWAEAGTMARILSAQYALLFCSQCVSYCRVSIGKQSANLWYSILHLLIVLSSCYLGYKCYDDLLHVILFFSVAQSMNYIFDMALNFYYLDKNIVSKYVFEAVLFSFVIYAVVLIKWV